MYVPVLKSYQLCPWTPVIGSRSPYWGLSPPRYFFLAPPLARPKVSSAMAIATVAGPRLLSVQ